MIIQGKYIIWFDYFDLKDPNASNNNVVNVSIHDNVTIVVKWTEKIDSCRVSKRYLYT